MVHTEISLPSGSSLALYSTTSVAISPDGRLVAFVADSDGSRHLYLRHLDSPESERLQGTGDARMPFFSPDGRWVGFFARRQLKKIAVSGGAPITICDAADVRGATWASNDQIIFTPSLIDGLHRIASEGGEPTVLTTLRRDEREKSHRMPAALPNGQGVLFVVGSADITSFDDARIEVFSFETGERRVLVNGGTSPRYVPTGHLLYARSDAILAVPFDQGTMQVTGPPTVVLEGVAVSPIWGNAELSVSPNGSLVFARGQVWGLDYRVLRVDRGGRREELFPAQGAFEMPRWSPDGKRIAIAEAGATDSVWLFDVDRGTLGPFATGWDNTDPVWSPDGQWIAFRSNRGGEEFDVYRKKSDGSGTAEKVVEHELRERPTSWSPDGETLLIRQDHPQTGNDILTLSLDDRELTPLFRAQADERDAAFSPDGRWIAFASDESGRFEVYVVPASSPDVKTMVSIGGGVAPRWNPRGGGELFYRSGDAFFAVTVTEGDRLSVETPRKLFEQRALFDAYDVSPDGRHFVLVDDSDAPPPPTRLELVQNWFQELERLVPREP